MTTGDLTADVVVIGAGPTGAAATWRLATSGLSVICLERGHWPDHEALGFDKPGYEARRAGRFHENPNIREGADDPPVDDTASPIKVTIGNGVGGGSLYWAAHIPRYRPEDFRVRSLDGVAEDWPIAYEDLVPYYDINEMMMGLAAVPGDPAGPPRDAAPRRMPSIGPAGRRLGDAFDRLGWHWWPVELATGAEAPPCTHIGPCDAGCPARRRAGAEETYLRPALAAGAQLVTGARVIALERDADGRVACAVVKTDAGPQRVHGARFVLAANGIFTPWLLLISGIGTSSGQLGRNLMLHPHAKVDGLFDAPLGGWSPGQKAGIVCLEFYATNTGRGFPRGCKLQLGAAPPPAAPACGAGLGEPLPWGAAHHAAFANRFDHIAGLTVCIEDLPEPENRITLSGTMRDRDGLPAPAMTYRLSEASRRNLDFGMARAEEALRTAGATATTRDPLREQAGFHLMGTARMGISPENSVVDPHGRCHDAPNLYLADASVFVTSGAMNPTSTAQALALRVADHIAGQQRC